MIEEESKTRPLSDSPKPGRELCACGHRASKHVVGKYTCQAPGDRKGYCPCMRFIPKKASRESNRRSLRRIPSAEK
jgi:hypothetical protein